MGRILIRFIRGRFAGGVSSNEYFGRMDSLVVYIANGVNVEYKS